LSSPLRIDDDELPVTHVTRRRGSSYTLVLKKTDALFARERRRVGGTEQIWSGSAEWNLGA
jgi:hypothetical protein